MLVSVQDGKACERQSDDDIQQDAQKIHVVAKSECPVNVDSDRCRFEKVCNVCHAEKMKTHQTRFSQAAAKALDLVERYHS